MNRFSFIMWKDNILPQTNPDYLLITYSVNQFLETKIIHILRIHPRTL